MFLEAVSILLLFLYAVAFYFENFRNRGSRAPGPMRFPPFGNLIQIALADKIMHVGLHKMAQKYGDIMSVKMGLTETLIFSACHPAREIFGKDESSGRDCTGFLLDRNLGEQNYGIGMSEGSKHTEARKFFLDSLAKYGFGGNREKMQELFYNEVLEFFKKMEAESKSNPHSHIYITSDYFHQIFMNVILILIMGKRLDYADPHFQDILQYDRDVVQNGAIGAGLFMAYPFLKYFVPKAMRFKSQMKGIRGFKVAALKCLNERRQEDFMKNPTCLTDDFLIKMEQDANKMNPRYTEDHYTVLYLDIMQAATDTVSNIVDTTILQLMVNPNIQEKLYHEISSIIGHNRIPTQADNLHMPYTKAVILEARRWSRAGIFGVPRKALRDFNAFGYDIKQGTVMMYNEHSIFFNEEYWGDPHVFRPERFFDNDGHLDVDKLDTMNIGFSAGKRACPGQTIARDQLFIAVTMLIQNFEFILPVGETPNLEPNMGLSLYVSPYRAIVKPRRSF